MEIDKINRAIWEEGDYFVAQCLDIELSSFGQTKDEAVHNLTEAIDYISMRAFKFLRIRILPSFNPMNLS